MKNNEKKDFSYAGAGNPVGVEYGACGLGG